MRILSTLALLLATTGGANAFQISDMDGPCNAYAAGKPDTTYPGGIYVLKGPEINQRVRVDRNADGTYSIVAGPERGTVTMFNNGNGTYVLQAHKGSGQCSFSIAKRGKGGTLSVYSAYRASLTATGSPLDALPYPTASENRRFMQKLGASFDGKGLFFTAQPEVKPSR